MKDKKNQSEYRKFRFVFLLVSTVFLFYLYQYNILFKVTSLNHALFPLMALTLFLGILVWNFKKYHYQLATIYIIGTYVLSLYLMFVSGGLKSPGVMWLVMYPYFCSVILGKKGAYLGFLLTGISMLVFYFFDSQDEIIYRYFVENNIYDVQHFLNFSIFLLFSCIITYFNFYINEKNTRLLKEGHTQIDNLLKIVIHDLANPLFLIKNKIRMLRRLSLERQAPELDKIDRAVINMSEQLAQVREIKAFQDGKFTLEANKINVLPLIKESITSLEHTAEKKILMLLWNIVLQVIF